MDYFTLMQMSHGIVTKILMYPLKNCRKAKLLLPNGGNYKHIATVNIMPTMRLCGFMLQLSM